MGAGSYFTTSSGTAAASLDVVVKWELLLKR
jgi:hypothetical protein